MGDVDKEVAAMRAELAKLRQAVEALTVQPETVAPERAAKMLDVSVETVRRMIRNDELLTVVISKRPKIPMSELRRLATPIARTPTVRPPKKKQRASTAKSEAEAIRAALKKSR